MSSHNQVEDYKELVQRFAEARIAVVGDMVADIYLYGRPVRLSREAPVLILRHEGETILPGSAANTANNLIQLGVKRVYPIGTVGSDAPGEALQAFFRQAPTVCADGLMVDPERPTPTKMRIMAGDVHTSKQQILRLDKEPPMPLSDRAERHLQQRLREISREVDAIIISDYGYQTITAGLRSVLDELKGQKVITVDSRYRIKEFKTATILTPNESEAARAANMEPTTESNLVQIGQYLLEQTEAQAVLITRGNQGMVLFERGQPPQWVPIWGRNEVSDVSGAGDTVASVCTVSLVSGASFLQAALLANYAAAVVVMKRGTATLTRQELVDIMEQGDGPIHSRP